MECKYCGDNMDEDEVQGRSVLWICPTCEAECDAENDNESWTQGDA